MRNRILLLILAASLAAGCSSLPASNGNAQQGGGSASPASTSKQSTVNAGIPTSTARPDEAEGIEQNFEGTAGITEKKNPNVKESVVMAYVRSARHEGSDRVVFEFLGDQLPSYKIEYIDKPVRACGSGDEIPLAGDAWLSVRFTGAQAHAPEGDATIPMRDRTQSPNLPVVKDLKLVCDFEAEVEWVMGVATPNKYRILELKKPTRLVVDIKQ
jgi:hypothetical protein